MEDRICLNLASLKHLDYESTLSKSAKVGFHAVGLHAIQVENYLASGHTLAEARSFLNSLGLSAPEMNFFPDWIYARGEEQASVFARFTRFCELTAGVGSRVIIATTVGEGKPDDVLAYENYTELCRIAGDSGVIAGLEFLPWAAVNSIASGWRLVERVNHPAAAIVLDIFHIMKGGSRLDEISAIPAEKIAIVHVNDLIDTGEDVITLGRKRRILPGEGQFPLREFIKAVRATGFKGWYALEILNENSPQEEPDVIVRRSFASMKTLMRETI